MKCTNEKMTWNTQDTNESWYVPKANVDHTINVQGTVVSTLDHLATTPRTITKGAYLCCLTYVVVLSCYIGEHVLLQTVMLYGQCCNPSIVFQCHTMELCTSLPPHYLATMRSLYLLLSYTHPSLVRSPGTSVVVCVHYL